MAKKEIRFILLLAISLLIIGCRQDISEKNQDFIPQTGDLLFQDLDCGPLCQAIEKVTGGYKGANLSHLGIVAKNDKGNFVVIEALPKGVEVAPLETFLNRSLDTDERPKVIVGRLKKNYRYLIPSAIKEAFILEGKPYDKAFAIGNNRYYCSELIYEIFLRANDAQPLFRLEPMTFKAPDSGVTFPVWEEYFFELGVSIPEGKPGINPGSISRSAVLTVICPYGKPDGLKKEDID